MCFGNFPPSCRPHGKIKVVVSFQNLYLTNQANSFGLTRKEKITYYLKRKFIGLNANNADFYISPTKYVSKALISTFNLTEEKCITLPFYDASIFVNLKEKFETEKKEKSINSFIYVSSALPHKNHKTLLDAWEILFNKGYLPKLSLTVQKDAPLGTEVIDRIKKLKEKNINIVNLTESGFLSYDKTLEQTYQHEFTIFPSLNETFGYGTIEGVALGNKLLISDLPFVKDVTQPSLTFNPLDANDIAEKVIFAMENEIPDSKLLFEDKIDDLINLLYKNV